MKNYSFPPGLDRLNELLQEIRDIEDFDLRSELLIEYGQQFVPVPDKIETRPYPQDHLVPGCESEAYEWVVMQPDGTLKIYFAVENPQGISAKALAAILDQALSGAPADEIAKVPEDIVYDIFGRGISMGKGHGLMGMVRMMKHLARNI